MKVEMNMGVKCSITLLVTIETKKKKIVRWLICICKSVWLHLYVHHKQFCVIVNMKTLNGEINHSNRNQNNKPMREPAACTRKHRRPNHLRGGGRVFCFNPSISKQNRGNSRWLSTIICYCSLVRKELFLTNYQASAFSCFLRFCRIP